MRRTPTAGASDPVCHTRLTPGAAAGDVVDIDGMSRRLLSLDLSAVENVLRNHSPDGDKASEYTPSLSKCHADRISRISLPVFRLGHYQEGHYQEA